MLRCGQAGAGIPSARGIDKEGELVVNLIKINRLLQEWDYGVLIPFVARLPLCWGRRISLLRGMICFVMDYDWRSNTLGYPYIRNRAMDFMAMFSSGSPRCRVLRRFMNNAVEEWQACLFRHEKKMGVIAPRCHMDHLEDFRRLGREKRGVVMVSAHFDSFCMGMVLMGMKGLKVHCINTSGIVDPRIAPEVREFFRIKYQNMERLMNGRMPFYEAEKAFFYERLHQGEMVVLMGDVCGSRSSLYIDFMGKKFRLPLSAWHMAVKTGSLLGGYMTLSGPGETYHTVCMPPFEPDPHDPVASLMPVYVFLEHWIRAFPERWVASDLLQSY